MSGIDWASTLLVLVTIGIITVGLVRMLRAHVGHVIAATTGAKWSPEAETSGGHILCSERGTKPAVAETWAGWRIAAR
jgi:hypothetical protein